LCPLIPAFPETPAPENCAAACALQSADEQRQFAERFVNERLGIWQQQLNLKDWRISVILARRCDLKPRTLGAIRLEKERKSAVIWVLDPADYGTGFREALGDIEFTVVHELVHLDLRSRLPKIANRSGEEQAVNRIASALLKPERQN
jgi:hypothetical protein